MSSSSHYCMPIGAELRPEGVCFRLWAPDCDSVELCLEEGPGVFRCLPLEPDEGAWYQTVVADAGPGTRYQYRINGDLKVPDAASRFQPNDVHGVSEVIDPTVYPWRSNDWRGRPWEEVVLYEVHVGTATREGTFAGLMARLPELVDLGITALELMPVADFPGKRDWGYNGTCLFAPDSVYGRPEDLKALIDTAHTLGLMVFMDVVYNHFGPEGNYLYVYAKQFFNPEKHTPWGAAINFDGVNSRPVRDFFINNALFWLEEYRIDGLRFDAVHAIDDASDQHILTEIAGRVHSSVGQDRHIHLVLENDKNEARFLAREPRDLKGGQYVAQWNDDVHHAFHVLLSGEQGGYYVDYADDPMRHLARCLTEGFAYQADPSAFRSGEVRGEVSAQLPLTAFVDFIQNHDQIGNRAMGDRIGDSTPIEAVRAASAVLLLAPSVPLLFMGEEWLASSPFQFFCNLGPDLEDSVRDGRRREFQAFPQFADPAALEKIPDPTDEATFHGSVLNWEERTRSPHGEMLAHYKALLAIRRAEIVPRLSGMCGHAGTVVWRHDRAVFVRWRLGDGAQLQLVANLGDQPLPAPDERAHGRCLYAFPAGDSLVGEGEGTLPPWSVVWFIDDARTQRP